MDLNQVQPSLNQFLRAVAQKVKIDEIIIFGSYMNGTATAESDIDVLVVSDDFKQMKEEARFRLLYQSSAFIEPDIHPWPFTHEELKKASELTTWGHARKFGIRYPFATH